MPKQFDLLIFDWDGTLMDSAGVIVDSIQRACEDIGLPTPSDRASRQIIGLGLVQALQALLPDLPADDYPRLVERYRHHYLGRDDRIPLFDGWRAASLNSGRMDFSSPSPPEKAASASSGRSNPADWASGLPPPAAPTRRIPSRIRRWCWS
jgi:beta-phosphoglucomutase-like phosphatase (HAD superfamily)